MNSPISSPGRRTIEKSTSVKLSQHVAKRKHEKALADWRSSVMSGDLASVSGEVKLSNGFCSSV